MIEVVAYDPAWPQIFGALRTRYMKALADVGVVTIEHVGSTSVPGLAAKPVVDVDIVVAAGKVEAAIRAMERIGFHGKGEQGIPGRWALEAPASLAPTHTYVIVDGSLALRNHLGVRDELRRNNALRDEYASLKRTLAQRSDDVRQYAEAKSEFLIRVLERAGLSPEGNGGR